MDDANSPIDDADDAGNDAPVVKRHCWKIRLCLIGHLLVALGMMAFLGFNEPMGMGLLSILLISLMVSQGSLLGIWAALGGPPTPWRFVAVVVGSVLLIWALDTAFPQRDAEIWGYFILVQLIATSLPLIALRFRGLGLTLPGDDLPGEKQRLQFSLRSLLEWTTAVAVLLGMLQMTPENFREPFTTWDGLAAMCGIFGADALLALATLWIALGARVLVARVAVFALTAIGVVIGVTVADPGSTPQTLLLPILSAVWMILSLWPFRSAGYRLIWRRVVRL